MGKNIPVYSINKFKKDPVKRKHYQVEVFDKNRNFQVEYPHRHDNFYEILFITKGSGSYTIDFREYPIYPNCLFFVSPGQVHSISFSEDIYGYIFIFTSEFYLLEKTDKNKLGEFPFFHNLTQETPPLKVKEPRLFENIFALTCKEISEEGIENESIAKASLDLILNLCKKYYPNPEKESKPSKGRILVKQFKQLVEENYLKTHLVQEFADLLSVTSNHLNETVKSLTGLTAKEHIKERQLLEIKRLLSHTDLNITEIAYRLNFNDQSYFCRFFKKYTGMSPNEFRKTVHSGIR